MPLSIWHKAKIQVNPDPTVIHSSMGRTKIVSMDIQEDQIIVEAAVDDVTKNQRGKYGHSTLICYNRLYLTKIVLVPQPKNEEDKTPTCHKIQTQLLFVTQNTKLFVTQNTNIFVTPKTVVDHNWYIDSGAKNHVVVEYSNLTNSTEYSSIEKVIVENGDCLYIFYVGNSCLTDGLMFQCSPDLSSPSYFLRDKSPTQ